MSSHPMAGQIGIANACDILDGGYQDLWYVSRAGVFGDNRPTISIAPEQAEEYRRVLEVDRTVDCSTNRNETQVKNDTLRMFILGS